MADAEKESTDAAPSLLAALAAMEERLKTGQTEMEQRQQERQDILCRAVQEAELQLANFKTDLKQLARDSCREVMQEVEEEVARLSETVDQCVGHLEARMQAVEQSALLGGAPLAAHAQKKRKLLVRTMKPET